MKKKTHPPSHPDTHIPGKEYLIRPLIHRIGNHKDFYCPRGQLLKPKVGAYFLSNSIHLLRGFAK